MIYEGQKQQFMQEAMELTKTDIAYFVLPSYWHKAKSIAEGAKKTADSWQSIDNANILIFTYKIKY